MLRLQCWFRPREEACELKGVRHCNWTCCGASHEPRVDGHVEAIYRLTEFLRRRFAVSSTRAESGQQRAVDSSTMLSNLQQPGMLVCHYRSATGIKNWR